jgi:hypothetical protein
MTSRVIEFMPVRGHAGALNAQESAMKMQNPPSVPSRDPERAA